MRRGRAGHLKENSCEGPFPEAGEPRPEQRTYCEDLPDSDDVQGTCIKPGGGHQPGAVDGHQSGHRKSFAEEHFSIPFSRRTAP